MHTKKPQVVAPRGREYGFGVSGFDRAACYRHSPGVHHVSPVGVEDNVFAVGRPHRSTPRPAAKFFGETAQALGHAPMVESL